MQKRVLLKQAIVKAKSRLSIDDLIEQMSADLSDAWESAITGVMTDIIADLEDRSKAQPSSFDEWERFENLIGPALGAGVVAAVSGRVAETTEAAYLMGMRAGATGSGVGIKWNLPDLKSLDILNQNTRFWIGAYYGDNLQKDFRAVMRDYFRGGYSRDTLTEVFKKHFEGVQAKSKPYWELLSDHMATKTREIGRVSGYEQAGVERVIWRSQLDRRTSAICRQMHGTVIEVRYLRKGVDNYLKACETQDKEKIKKSWPWWSEKDVAAKLTSKKAVEKQIKAGNIFCPPAHGRCRSITVSEFGDE